MCYSALVRRDFEYLHRRYGTIVIREQIDDYLRTVAAEPKRFPPLEERIYPGHYAPVGYYPRRQACGEAPVLTASLMRYGTYPPPSVADPKRYTTFNARRDNLTSSFWSTAFLQHHGFAVLGAFYEWVAVKDLLEAGVVSLDAVKAEFAKQAEERKAKILAAGKAYRPTPTEAKDARFRQIVIEFKPADGEDLLVPVIFSVAKLPAPYERWDAGFAVITDEPPPEIRAAGHDRCPVVLPRSALEAWLHPEGRTAADLEGVLREQRRVSFTHKLAEVA